MLTQSGLFSGDYISNIYTIMRAEFDKGLLAHMPKF